MINLYISNEIIEASIISSVLILVGLVLGFALLKIQGE
nr:cytochrome b6-f complex subunit 7 [Hypnea pseudomusciformis]WCH55151.1 cytochrome b6-f complex subunit 7 [Hypnea pseudomusciformis]WCH56744.1 cytochrome b6-f complex subunit 7 [Hypnea pseudomusciformis]